MIPITKNILLDEKEISEDFIRASGPGGQNVNKVSSAVQLRFNVAASKSIPENVKARLIKISGKRVNSQGELIISSSTHRTQLQNRNEACAKLVEMIRNALHTPVKRRKTKPTISSRNRRLDSKKKMGHIKAGRKRTMSEEC